MRLGDWELTTVSGGTLRLDGGAMFGVVPKPLWQKLSPPDERNRIRMATNCLLARAGRHTILVDTGYGGKVSERQREFDALEAGEPLLESLARVGVAPEQIDYVALTHLHFDHCGGATRYDRQQRIVPTFPNARYLVSSIEWQTANSNAPELQGSYPPENFRVLGETGRLRLLEQPEELLPGFRWMPAPGHTAGHVAYVFESRGETAVYPCDLCPTTAHLRRLWCMAYDVDLLETRRRKPALLGRAADEGWWICWGHDPDIAASRLARDARREFIVVDPIERL